MRRAASLALAMLALGCEGDAFVPPSLVEGPRLLAVIADRPVVAPGQDVTLTPFVAGPDGAPDVTMEYRASLSTRALSLAAGQDIGEDAPPLALVTDGRTATLPGEATQAAIDALLALVAGAPAGTPEDVVRLVYETVGLVVTVELVMRGTDGAVVVEGFKRLLLMPAPEAVLNPPPPRFAIGDAWVDARDAASPFDCAAETDPPRVLAGAEVTLAPEGDEDWLERYPALDLEGRLVESVENAYYSWFSTGGDFTLAVTRAPNRETVWTAPETPGTVPIWLVVRDGHLGTSACRAEVIVVEP